MRSDMTPQRSTRGRRLASARRKTWRGGRSRRRQDGTCLNASSAEATGLTVSRVDLVAVPARAGFGRPWGWVGNFGGPAELWTESDSQEAAPASAPMPPTAGPKPPEESSALTIAATCSSRKWRRASSGQLSSCVAHNQDGNNDTERLSEQAAHDGCAGRASALGGGTAADLDGSDGVGLSP